MTPVRMGTFSPLGPKYPLPFGGMFFNFSEDFDTTFRGTFSDIRNVFLTFFSFLVGLTAEYFDRLSLSLCFCNSTLGMKIDFCTLFSLFECRRLFVFWSFIGGFLEGGAISGFGTFLVFFADVDLSGAFLRGNSSAAKKIK